MNRDAACPQLGSDPFRLDLRDLTDSELRCIGGLAVDFDRRSVVVFDLEAIRQDAPETGNCSQDAGAADPVVVTLSLFHYRSLL